MSRDGRQKYSEMMGTRSLSFARRAPWRFLALAPLQPLLAGCNAVVLKPSGDVAVQQRDLLIVSTGLMLLVIIPVMALTVFFAWKYRESNKNARYEPDWDHSTQLELVVWAGPLLIIIWLGAITWMGTHILDPYRQIARIAPSQPVFESRAPLQVEVVALDWKWLFIYPQYGVASVNELAAPVDRPIDFKITSSSVMNSFYIPALAGQIYAMPGMVTQLHAVINAPGNYDGFSANYSGAGFSGMQFRFLGQSSSDFDQWTQKLKSAGNTLDRDAYKQLEKPSENVPVSYYGSVAADLYHAVVNLCVDTGKMCQDEMMRIDSKGGLGLEGVNNLVPLTYDKFARRGSVFGPEPSYVASLCERPKNGELSFWSEDTLPLRDMSPVRGAGLPAPGTSPEPASSSSPL